jgi:hypothetical protein
MTVGRGWGSRDDEARFIAGVTSPGDAGMAI